MKTIQYALGHFQTRSTSATQSGFNPNHDVTFCDGPTIIGAVLPTEWAKGCAETLNALISSRNASCDAAEIGTDTENLFPLCNNDEWAIMLAGAANALIANRVARFS